MVFICSFLFYLTFLFDRWTANPSVTALLCVGTRSFRPLPKMQELGEPAPVAMSTEAGSEIRKTDKLPCWDRVAEKHD